MDRLFWLRCERVGQCIEFRCAPHTHGYSRLRFQGRVWYAHRFVWRVLLGRAIPDGLCICHRCDNPRCVRPEHLFLGTQRDNQLDRIAKRRGVVGLPGHAWREIAA